MMVLFKEFSEIEYSTAMVETNFMFLSFFSKEDQQEGWSSLVSCLTLSSMELLSSFFEEAV